MFLLQKKGEFFFPPQKVYYRNTFKTDYIQHNFGGVNFYKQGVTFFCLRFAPVAGFPLKESLFCFTSSLQDNTDNKEDKTYEKLLEKVEEGKE